MSDKTLHTPGPWRITKVISASENDKGFNLWSGDQWLGKLSPINDEDGNKTQEAVANAALICAAPDLLAALKKICERWTFNDSQQHTHTWHDWADCIPDARVAVAKATPNPS